MAGQKNIQKEKNEAGVIISDSSNVSETIGVYRELDDEIGKVRVGWTWCRAIFRRSFSCRQGSLFGVGQVKR
jgi:hypothetical protein